MGDEPIVIPAHIEAGEPVDEEIYYPKAPPEPGEYEPDDAIPTE